MSQLVHFYGGDPAVIGRAFGLRDFRTLYDRAAIPLFADFSLHLSPIDYDLLCEAIRSSVGRGPLSLTDSLESQVGGDGNEGSADTVSTAWVDMWRRSKRTTLTRFCGRGRLRSQRSTASRSRNRTMTCAARCEP
jgi:hypothetical protein